LHKSNISTVFQSAVTGLLGEMALSYKPQAAGCKPELSGENRLRASPRESF
jgi:hypothetical protein